MKPSRTNPNIDSRSEQVVTIFAAFLGLGTTIWANSLFGIQQGDAAVAAYFLIGLPTYKLFLVSFSLFQRLRLKMIHLERRQQSLYRTLLPRLATTVAIVSKIINTP